MSLLDLDFSAPAPPKEKDSFDPLGDLNQSNNETPVSTDGFDAAFAVPPPSSDEQKEQKPATPQGQQEQKQQEPDFNFGAFEISNNSSQRQDSPSLNATAPETDQTTTSSLTTDTSADADGGTVENTEQETVGTATDEDKPQRRVISAGPLDMKGKLKEFDNLFSGKWRLLRGDPFGEYLKSVGVGVMTRNRASSGTTDLQIGVKDECIFINSSTVLHSQILKYKLDETEDMTWMKTQQSVFCSYQDQKLELQLTPATDSWGKTHSVQYSINDRGELMVAYTSASNVCRRIFTKVTLAS